MTMLPRLHLVQSELKALLAQDIWKSVYVDYHEPYVERLWCEWEGYRIYLHRIHPCRRFGLALFHLHPWPSAMKVVSGSYMMAIGYGEGDNPPPIAATILLPTGAEYEMTNINAWHYVRPTGKPSLSLMITGKPWDRWSHKSTKPLRELTEFERERLLEDFRKIYT